MRTLTEEENRKAFETKWPEWKLIKYSGINGPCTIKHKCGKEKTYDVFVNLKRREPICDICKEKTNWYWEIGDVVGDLEIINRRALPNTLQEYQYKCTICSFDCSKPMYVKGEFYPEYWVPGHNIKGTQRKGYKGCACCRGLAVQHGINNVGFLYPDLLQYLVDEEEGEKWPKASRHKTNVKCPICGAQHDKKISIQDLVNHGFQCINCGSGISYPEKMIYFLLNRLNASFEMHKTFDWSKSIYNPRDGKFHKREYDFLLTDINTIIEVHGAQHYREDSVWGEEGTDRETLDDRQFIDQQKQEIAMSHGYDYIVIDCLNSNKSYIVNSIMDSCLSEIYNLNNVNWNEISRKALNGVSKLLVEDKEMHPEKTTTDLALECGVHLSTVIRWLKKAGIYDPKESLRIVRRRNSIPYYSPGAGIAFRSIKDAAEYAGVTKDAIRNAVVYRKNCKYAGHHPETGEPLTWERWTIEQYEEWINLHNTKL